MKNETEKMLRDDYTGQLFGYTESALTQMMVGIPLTGLIRAEWAIARYGQTVPCNWSMVDAIQWIDVHSPIGFQVADARNIIASQCVEKDFKWLFFIDHDVLLPPTTLLVINDAMHEEKIPMWSGLYFTKSVPSEPLVYRGRGNSYYDKWKMGDKVWVDGIPMGCTLIHSSILKVLYEESEQYTVKGYNARRIFKTPTYTHWNPETQSWYRATGTEDLDLCSRIMREDIFEKAGWGTFQKKEFPFICDTNVFCRHINWEGQIFPSSGEEKKFNKKKK